VAQVVEYLLCKHKALSSNPSPTKKKKKSGELVMKKETPLFKDKATIHLENPKRTNDGTISIKSQR
jgi:hypothetical protein